jgi:Ca-activated chloride channel family protein
MVLHHLHGGPRFLLCLAASFTLLLFSAVLRAQEPEPVDVISVRTDLVAVPFSVTDSLGRRVSDLKQPDFAVTEDGRALKIDYFAAGAERIALVFVLDNSGSLREQLARQRDAALGLFARFGATSSIAVIRFGQFAKLVTPFTSDAARARAAFTSPVDLSERTAIFNAGLAAIETYNGRPENSPERRIAILISDGLDTASKATAPQVIAAANRANVSFYVIHLPLFTPKDGRLSPRPAAKGFRQLAEKTGGQYFVAGTSASVLNPNSRIDLTPVFTAIENDLRSQYVIGFYPGAASRDGNLHRLAVSAVNRKLKVDQIRTSYSLKPGP